MSLLINRAPSQGGETLELTTIFLEDATQAGLQAKINALANLPSVSTATPTGSRWIADVQYQAASSPGGINYSVMIIVGEWNPT